MIIGICDDEIKCVGVTRICCDRFMKEYKLDTQYVTFGSGEEVLEYEEQIDILFLDIEMQGIDGIKTMEVLEKRSNIKNIFFVSSHSDCVFDTFGAKTRGFICKPIEYDRFAREVKKVIDKLRDDKIVEFIIEGRPITILVRDIVYLESADKYVKVFTENEDYLISGSIGSWEQKFADCNFVRIHKSYLVNLDFVMDMKDNVTISLPIKKLPIGRKYKDNSRNVYWEYIRKRFRGDGS